MQNARPRDPFGVPRDLTAEVEIQRHLDRFLYAIGCQDAVEAAIAAHINCQDRIDMNPYRMPRGDAVRAQLENINAAEWGSCTLSPLRQRYRDGVKSSQQGTSLGVDEERGPLIARGHGVGVPPRAQHNDSDLGGGTEPRHCTDASDSQRRGSTTVAGDVLDQLADLLLAALAEQEDADRR